MGWLFWIGLFFTTGAWFYLLPFNLEADETGSMLFAAGLFFMVLACRDVTLKGTRRQHYLLVIPALTFAVLVPTPYNLPGLVLSCAVILLPAGRRFPYLWPLPVGLALGGAVSLAQASAALAYRFLAPRLHDAGFVSPVVSSVLDRLGLTKAGQGGGRVYLSQIEDAYTFTPGWEHLGLLAVLLIIGGASVVFIFSLAKKRYLAVCLGLAAVYVVFRYILVILLYLQTDNMSVHYHRIYVLITFLPLFAMLANWVPLRASGVVRVRSGLTGVKWTAAWMAAGLAFVCLVGTLCYQDPGLRKDGRVIVDEFHSDWEWTDREYDTQWYGMESGYNYYDLFRYLSYFYKTNRGEEPISRELLAQCDVLVVKTPTEAFSAAERDAILEFVRKGGGLVLIGDHTNVFGSSIILNTIADPVGMHFVHDSTYDIVSGGLSLYKPPTVFPHPAVSHMSTFMFATSCSMTGDLKAEGVILGHRLRALPADYSQVSFFPEEGVQPDFRFGSFYQAMASRYGKGRVIGFSDSTVFSNFFMFMPGKPELALGLIEWANHKQRFHWLRYMFLAGFAALLAVTAGVLRGHTPGGLPVRAICIVAAALTFIPPAVRGFTAINVSSFRLPSAHTPVPVVAFEAEHSRFFVPRYRLAREGDVDFDTFYVWAQRKGLVPTVKDRLEDAIAGSGITVIINPATEFTPEERASVREYVADGGRLLLLDDASNVGSTANQILAPFGMEVDFSELQSESPADSTVPPGPIEIDRGAGTVHGGEAIVVSKTGRPVLSQKSWEKGLVIAFSNSHIFERAVLGPVGNVPSSSQLLLYEAIYDIYDRVTPDHYVTRGAGED